MDDCLIFYGNNCHSLIDGEQWIQLRKMCLWHEGRTWREISISTLISTYIVPCHEVQCSDFPAGRPLVIRNWNNLIIVFDN